MFDHFDDLWAAYYAPRLTKREVNQFSAACRRSDNRLLDRIIKPMALDRARNSYLCIHDNPEVKGRPYFRALDVISGSDAWCTQSYFTNALRIANPNDADFGHPKDRVVMAPYHVLTMEYDSKALVFFKQQLAWFRTPHHPLDSPLGRFVRELRDEFADFVGLNVTYSGSKSFHYHFVFSTHLIAERVATPTSVRYGFTKAWEALERLMRASPHLDIPADVSADPSVRHPEWFRRLPGGVREINKPQFFGVPVGEIVPQLIMWEHLPVERHGSGDTSLFDPSLFTLTSLPTNRSKRSVEHDFTIGSALERFCAAKLSAIFDGETVWPRFEGFRWDRDEFRAYFANSYTDKHPASYMSERFSTVMICGDNPHRLSNDRTDSTSTLMPRLAKPLGDMIADWSLEYAMNAGRARTSVEQAFADVAVDHQSASRALAPLLKGLVAARRSG